MIRTHRHYYSTVVHAISNQECSEIARALHQDGFGVTSRILSEGAVDAVNLKMPDLFRGEFETGVYPDEWHWR
jgi:hypothetical protein